MLICLKSSSLHCYINFLGWDWRIYWRKQGMYICIDQQFNGESEQHVFETMKTDERKFYKLLYIYLRSVWAETHELVK